MSGVMLVSFVFISNFYSTFALPIIIDYNGEKEVTENPLILDLMKQNTIENENQQCSTNNKGRQKRASGGDKFSNAATMTEMKMFQMYLQLFKNMFASSYIGGGHPLHPDVPKAVLLLFKQKVLTVFFPPVGDDAKKV